MCALYVGWEKATCRAKTTATLYCSRAREENDDLLVHNDSTAV
jgi:hypothetical protein